MKIQRTGEILQVRDEFSPLRRILLLHFKDESAGHIHIIDDCMECHINPHSFHTWTDCRESTKAEARMTLRIIEAEAWLLDSIFPLER